MKIKRGFTLIELLAVIVILGLLAAITIPSIIKFSDKSKQNLYCDKLDIVEKAAEQYGDTISLTSFCEIEDAIYPCETVSIDTLLTNNFLVADDDENNIVDPRTKISMNNTKMIIYEKNNRVYSLTYIKECGKGDKDASTSDETTSFTHVLNINPNGGEYENKSFASFRLREGDTKNLSIPSRDNFIFTNWSISSSNSTISGATFTMGNADTLITANWEPVYIYKKLVVNPNGGVYDGEYFMSLALGESVELTTPVKDGYVFNGWTISEASSTFNEATNGFTMGSRDTVITANWMAYAEMFTYTVNNAPGVANTDYELIDDGNGNWRIKFKTNGTFTPLLNMTIDVFLVGGGGGGATGLKGGSSNGIGGGGGGGYTSTTPLDVSKNNLYSVVIGVGGGPGSPGAAGGSSSFGTTSVLGGRGGCRKSADCGGNGGSGGSTYYGVGGSNGGNGENYNTNRGVGQGTTTCEFGQGTIENGCDTGITLYAGGGTAGTWNGSRLTGGVGGGGFGGASDGDATAGTNYLGGGGGGGGGGDTRNTGGGAGGSGIVIIRNHRVSVN